MTRFTPFRLRASKLPVLGSSKLRAAQLTAATSFDGVDAFPSERWRDLESFAPHIVIGPVSALQRLMERMELLTVDLTSVDHAVFVVTELGDKPLSDNTRMVLWRHFGVPVYELYLDSWGNLLASECEAQEGWHIEPGVRFSLQNEYLVWQSSRDGAFRTGLKRFLVDVPCACGRPGLRIMDPELHSVQDTAPLLAATA